MSFVDRSSGCLFCGNQHGRFTSEEHVVAFALGNATRSGLVESELVIPSGEICDKCNRRRLSLRDKALADWPPVSAFRTLAQIANRRGRLVDADGKTRWKVERYPKDPLAFRLHLTADTGPASGRDEVGRALCKVALETRWLKDPVDARSRRWDAVAAAAIGGPLPPDVAIGLSYPTDPADVDLTPKSSVLVNPDSLALQFCSQLWVVGLGLLMVIDTPPPPIPDTAWWTLDPSGSLAGPDLLTAAFEGRADTAQHLGQGSDAPPSGHSSRLPTDDPHTSIYLQPSIGQQ